MRTIDRTIVAALIVSRDGKIFQGKKDPKKGGVYPDCWHIPGGGVEAGETNDAALVREVREETGLDATSYTRKLIDDTGMGTSEKIVNGERVLCRMHFFTYRIDIARDATDIPVALNDDLVEYRWSSPSELRTIRLTPPSQELFKKLGYI